MAPSSVNSSRPSSLFGQIKSNVLPLEAARILNIPENRNGSSVTFDFPHWGCEGRHNKGKDSAVYYWPVSGHIHCRKCDTRFDVVKLVAADRDLDLPSRWSLDDPAVQEVLDVCASYGWCDPRPGSGLNPVALPPKKKRPPAPPPSGGKKKIEKWHTGRVADEFTQLEKAMLDHGAVLDRFGKERGWSEDIVGSLTQSPPPGVAFAHASHEREAPGLVWKATTVARLLLFAVYNATGEIVSVNRRAHNEESLKRNDHPKAMALSSELVGGNFSARCFGNPVEVVKAAKEAGGGVIFMGEGSPDYLAASGLVNLGHGVGAVAGESAYALPRVARALAKQIREQKAENVKILAIPDLKFKEDGTPDEENAGLRKMRQAEDILDSVCDVYEVLLPPAHDGAADVDLSDIATSLGSAEQIMTLLESRATLRSVGFPDLYSPNAEGYLPAISFTPGSALGVRASLGSGKTYRAKKLKEIIEQLGGEVIAMNHRKDLSRQLAALLNLPSYEDLDGQIDEPCVICLNSINRLDNFFISRKVKAIIIDELESFMTQLFGDTLNIHSLDNSKPNTVKVAEKLKFILKTVIENGGMLLFLDAHLNHRTVEALLEFAGVDIEPQYTHHIAPLDDLSIQVYDKKEELLTDIRKRIENNDGKFKRFAIATDSRREGQLVYSLIKEIDKNIRVKFYHGDMNSLLRNELEDVETHWSSQECDVVIYTPSIDAGVSYNPDDINERFDTIYGLFRGSANLPASSMQQMMFRCRNVKDHRVYIADRSNSQNIDLKDIIQEVHERTVISEHRLHVLGKFVPFRNHQGYFDLIELEAKITQLNRMRTRRIKEQMLALYSVRGASVINASATFTKEEKKATRQQARDALNAYKLRRAQAISAAPILGHEEYEERLRERRKDQALKDSLEHSRLLRQFGDDCLDLELIAGDEYRRITRAIRNNVRLRLALEGRLELLAEQDAQDLQEGYGSRRRGPDVIILAQLLMEIFPREELLRIINPSPAEMEFGLPTLSWSYLDFARDGTHKWVAYLLDSLAEYRGVSPATVLSGLKISRDKLEKPQGLVTFIGAVLSWIGLGTVGTKIRITDSTLEEHGYKKNDVAWTKREVKGEEGEPSEDGAGEEKEKRYEWKKAESFRIYQFNAATWEKTSMRCFVEAARQRKLDVDPLNPLASPWTGILDEDGFWKAPLIHGNRYVLQRESWDDERWNVLVIVNYPDGGTKEAHLLDPRQIQGIFGGLSVSRWGLHDPGG